MQAPAHHLIRSAQCASVPTLQAGFQAETVDMKTGLAIAWLSIYKIVDRILPVAGDSDFIPAMKLARIEGL
jgi:uncharacterized LabA/DUF88 family protein